MFQLSAFPTREAVEIRDLEFAARARFQAGGEVARPRVVEVEPGHGEVAPRFIGLFLQADRFPGFFIELNHPKALGVADVSQCVGGR